MKKLAVGLVAMVVVQCAQPLDPNSATVLIRLPGMKDIPRVGSASTYSAVPTSTSGFDCYVINVMGTGINASGVSPNQATMDAIIAGSKCTYAGVMSNLIPISTGGSVELTIPKGTSRVIQVLGVLSPGGCSISTALRDRFDRAPSMVADPIFPGVYELGRAVADVTANTAVTINNTYTSTGARDARCAVTTVDCTNTTYTQTTPVGNGVPADPYRICKGNQLSFINSHLTEAFALETNLDLSGGYTPVSGILSGQFDGQGYTISNVSLTGAFGSNPCAFIPKASGIIKRFNLVGFDYTPTSATAVAGLVGLGTAGLTIQNVNVNGAITITGSPTLGNIGGMVGTVTSPQGFSDSTADVTINSSGTGPNVGGFVGNVTSNATGGSITKCSARGSIALTAATGQINNGGFIGNSGGTASFTISKSFATGNVTGLNNVGGFAGTAQLSSAGVLTVSDCYSTGTVSCSVVGCTAGGFYGKTASSTPSAVNTSYTSTTSVTASGPKGAFTGTVSTGTHASCYASSLVTGGAGFNGNNVYTPAQMTALANFAGFDFNNIWTIVEGVSSPTLR